MDDIGNAFWKGIGLSARGWRVEIRIRRKGHRAGYRRWMKIDVFNYDYQSTPSDTDPPMPNEPTTCGRCHNCGRDWEGDQDA